MEKDWFEIALDHFHENDYSQALFAIIKYIGNNPDDKNGKLVNAFILRDMGNYAGSFKLFNEIVPVDSDDDEYKKSYYSGLGNTYKETGNFIEAIICFDKYIVIAANETPGYILKGNCLITIGKLDEARKEFLTATTLEGDPEEAFYNLALLARSEMKYQEAKEYCERSLEIFPADEQVINCLRDVSKTIKLIEEYGK